VEEEVGLGMAFHFLEQTGCPVLLRRPVQTYKGFICMSADELNSPFSFFLNHLLTTGT
jgi:hypothetical protein